MTAGQPEGASVAPRAQTPPMAATGAADHDPAAELALAVIERLTRAGQTVAVAESLTGGLVTSALVSVPGASVVLRGGVVAYATDLKHRLLGVDPKLLARVGAVDHRVALAMASGVRERLGATYGIGTTGVAGPDPQDGQPVGMVYVAASSSAGGQAAGHVFSGDRAAVRSAAVEAALRLLLGELAK